MKLELQQDYISPAVSLRKGEVIDASDRPADQINRWIKRGVVKPVEERRTAVTGKERRKAAFNERENS